MENTENTNNLNKIQIKEKQGFHRWAWLVIFLLGGLLMVFGGVQDVLLFFKPEISMVAPWHPIPSTVGLICGLIVLISAISNIILSLLLRKAIGNKELRIVIIIASISLIGLVADLISGYYGFGNLVALIICIILIIIKIRKTKESTQIGITK